MSCGFSYSVFFLKLKEKYEKILKRKKSRKKDVFQSAAVQRAVYLGIVVGQFVYVLAVVAFFFLFFFSFDFDCGIFWWVGYMLQFWMWVWLVPVCVYRFMIFPISCAGGGGRAFLIVT